MSGKAVFARGMGIHPVHPDGGARSILSGANPVAGSAMVQALRFIRARCADRVRATIDGETVVAAFEAAAS